MARKPLTEAVALLHPRSATILARFIVNRADECELLTLVDIRHRPGYSDHRAVMQGFVHPEMAQRLIPMIEKAKALHAKELKAARKTDVRISWKSNDAKPLTAHIALDKHDVLYRAFLRQYSEELWDHETKESAFSVILPDEELEKLKESELAVKYEDNLAIDCWRRAPELPEPIDYIGRKKSQHEMFGYKFPQQEEQCNSSPPSAQHDRTEQTQQPAQSKEPHQSAQSQLWTQDFDAPFMTHPARTSQSHEAHAWTQPEDRPFVPWVPNPSLAFTRRDDVFRAPMPGETTDHMRKIREMNNHDRILTEKLHAMALPEPKDKQQDPNKPRKTTMPPKGEVYVDGDEGKRNDLTAAQRRAIEKARADWRREEEQRALQDRLRRYEETIIKEKGEARRIYLARSELQQGLWDVLSRIKEEHEEAVNHHELCKEACFCLGKKVGKATSARASPADYPAANSEAEREAGVSIFTSRQIREDEHNHFPRFSRRSVPRNTGEPQSLISQSFLSLSSGLPRNMPVDHSCSTSADPPRTSTGSAAAASSTDPLGPSVSVPTTNCDGFGRYSLRQDVDNPVPLHNTASLETLISGESIELEIRPTKNRIAPSKDGYAISPKDCSNGTQRHSFHRSRYSCSPPASLLVSKLPASIGVCSHIEVPVRLQSSLGLPGQSVAIHSTSLARQYLSDSLAKLCSGGRRDSGYVEGPDDRDGKTQFPTLSEHSASWETITESVDGSVKLSAKDRKDSGFAITAPQTPRQTPKKKSPSPLKSALRGHSRTPSDGSMVTPTKGKKSVRVDESRNTVTLIERRSKDKKEAIVVGWHGTP